MAVWGLSAGSLEFGMGRELCRGGRVSTGSSLRHSLVICIGRRMLLFEIVQVNICRFHFLSSNITATLLVEILTIQQGHRVVCSSYGWCRGNVLGISSMTITSNILRNQT